MFRSQRLSLFFIVLGLLIAIGTGLKAHFIHDVSDKDLSFTSSPTISCNIDGYNFTHTRETYSDGVIYTDSWWRNPLDPSVSMSAEAHGFGYAHVLFYGNIDGKKHGDDTNTTPQKLGSWSGLLPFAGGIDHTISADFYDSFNRSYKTYSWSASGSIKLVPYYWHWEFPGVGSSWQPAPSDFHTTQTASGGGNWKVQKNWTTLTRPSPGSTPPTGSGSTPPTGSGSGGGSQPPSGSQLPPTDNTPNCPDCTSDCSSPCNCTNSGTCGGTVSTPPSGSTPPSPSYHACNVHETSVSGDHSYISSCSSSNANGTCQNSSGYYACSPHSHSYPSPPPPPEPPSPTLCPANDWTGLWEYDLR